MANTMTRDIAQSDREIICVDGARRMTDFLKIPNAVLVYIESDARVRFDRLATRNQNTDDATKTFEQFLKDEERSTEKSIDDLATHATEIIFNNGTPEELHASLDLLIKKYEHSNKN
jgi:dephospho-CoA kinase